MNDVVIPARTPAPRRFKAIERKDLRSIPQIARLPEREVDAMEVVASVLPFRVNQYVLDELIDWSRVPEDPIFQLTFPQRGMLGDDDFASMERLLADGAPAEAVRAEARRIQAGLNPHPAGQLELNTPMLGERRTRGLQHKYRETVLFFPAQGQTCHAYCTYCFRWPQFVGLDDMKFASREAGELVAYLKEHPEVTDVLITGGDPMLMKTTLLRRYIEPLLAADLPHLATIRIGTKATAYWPHRFVTDSDADDLMMLFEEVGAAGRTLALMAHYSHPRELETPMAQRAVRRIRETGAVVRCQAPIIRHVNDDALAWAEMWRLQVQLGAVPYYAFVERDTGARRWFEVPLVRAWEIFRDATARVSGLARTARGPSMSATPGKVVVDGPATIRGERVLALRFLQARDPAWVGRPFFAQYDEQAAWFDALRPAFGEREFFFESEMREIREHPDSARQAFALERRRLPIFGASAHAEVS
jgi:KamA family protein